jgi:MFS family permease
VRAATARGTFLQFGLLLAIAIILRCDTFGDPNIGGDEVFYHQVGLAMHHGAWPYVDLWDRKPFGLFALFYLITALSAAPLAYQLAATLFAAATAWVIGRIAQRWAGALGGLLAGVVYLLWLGPLQGFGGQSPVFYNLFIAAAALLVVDALPRLRLGHTPPGLLLAMLLGGCAITIKTTTFVEAGFLGLLSLVTLCRSGAGPKRTLSAGLTWAALGAAPTVAIGLAYWLGGHWTEYWHAMITANLAKPPYWLDVRIRILLMFIMLAPVIIPAVLGLLDQARESRRFVLLWLGAAVLGLAAMPNFYIHYALPLLVPLCVAASTFLARPRIGLLVTAALAVLSVMLSPIFQFGQTARSRAAIADLTQAVRAHVGAGPLLVYDGPPQLYQTTGQPFVTPLVFPTHLSQLIEKDVSHLSTLGETRRVLALKPGAVVAAVKVRNSPGNQETRQLVMAYAGRNCRLIKVVDVPERLRSDFIAVWGDCRG